MIRQEGVISSNGVEHKHIFLKNGKTLKSLTVIDQPLKKTESQQVPSVFLFIRKAQL